jgi:hypothetical protein
MQTPMHTAQSSLTRLTEHQLRKEIDRSVSRALFDGEYARHLLADPSVILGDHGFTPQQQVELRGIRATTVVDFARQAEALFWPRPSIAYARADEASLAAAAI